MSFSFSASSISNYIYSLPNGTSVVGRYQINRPLGHGGMGEVYEVKELANNRIWAMKRILNLPADHAARQETLNLFEQETEILKLSQHPGLPRFHDHFEVNGDPFLVMEFVDGQTLAEILASKNGQPLEYEVVLKWGLELAEVLLHLHTGLPQRIIYRDLKPENVMCTPPGKLKLIDFGIARFFDPAKAKDTIVLGTIGYAPPELVFLKNTDQRADIYSLGATLHHLLTNQDPRNGSTRSAIGSHSFSPVRTFRADVPLEFEEAIKRMTQLDRDQRPSGMIEVQALLKRVPLPPPLAVPKQPANPGQPPLTNPLNWGQGPSGPTILITTTPGLQVQPSVIDFGRVLKNAAPIEQTLVFSGAGRNGETLNGKVTMLAPVPWLALESTSFAAPLRLQLKLKAIPAQAPLGHNSWRMLSIPQLYRQLTQPAGFLPGWLLWLGLLGLILASVILSFWSLLLIILGVLIMAQLYIWLYQALIRLIVVGPNQLEATLQVRSNGGNEQVKVFLQIYPSFLQVWFRFAIATLIALIPLALALLIIFRRGS